MRIELSAVGKRYGKVVALDRIDLALPAGRKVALIGPNGSGKTTLTRVIMGLVHHDGDVRIDGRQAWRDRVELAHRLAYVPQVAPQMAATVGEIVRTVSDVRGLSQAWIAEIAARLELEVAPLRRRSFRSLSGGMKQKLLIALALASRPSLLILDEPTASLDAASRARFFDLVQDLAGEATLLLCSHRLEEIRSLVEHVVALENGRLVHDGAAVDYLAACVGSLLELRVDGEPAWLASNGFRRGAGGWWSRVVDPTAKLRLVPHAVTALGAALRDLSIRDIDLVEVGEEAHRAA